MQNKRGLSPVIATTLLILIAVILAVIIFLWVRNFIGEKVQKDLGGGPEPIESFCEQLGFNGEVILDLLNNKLQVTIVNNKNVPIYGVEIVKKGLASKKIICAASSTTVGVTSGEDQSLDTSSCNTNGLKINDELILVPIIIGESGETKKAYTCDETYGLETKLT